MSDKDKGDLPVQPVKPKRPTTRPKQQGTATAAFSVTQRPVEDSWAEEPGAPTVETESASDELPQKGSTLRTGPIFVDQVEKPPSEPPVAVDALVADIAEVDPEMANAIRSAYAGSSLANDTADIDAEFARLMGEAQEVVTNTGDASVPGPPVETPPAEKEDEMSKDQVDPHAATTATPIPQELAGLVAPANGQTVPEPETPIEEPRNTIPAPEPVEAVSVPAPVEPEPAILDQPAQPVPVFSPALVMAPETRAKSAPAVETPPKVVVTPPLPPKPVVHPQPSKGTSAGKNASPPQAKDALPSKHNATTAAIPPGPPNKPTKSSFGFRLVATLLILVAIALVGWKLTYLLVGKDHSDKTPVVVTQPVAPAPVKEAKVAKETIKTIVPNQILVDAGPAPSIAMNDAVADATAVAIDERLKMALPEPPEDGYTPVDENSPIAKYIDGTATPKNIGDCLPKTTVELQELDVVRCCEMLPSARLRATCMMYSSIQVLNTEDAL